MARVSPSSGSINPIFLSDPHTAHNEKIDVVFSINVNGLEVADSVAADMMETANLTGKIDAMCVMDVKTE